jgi:hypothetical protein
MLPGIEAAARAAGRTVRFTARAACPPLLGVDRADREASHDCSGFNAAVLAMLHQRNDMQLVILVARWALIAEGRRPSGEPGGHAILTRPGETDGDLRPENNFSLFAPALAKTVSGVLETGRQVLIILDVPEFGWSVPERLADHLRYGTPLPRAPTSEEVALRNRRVNQVLSSFADSPDVRVVRIAPSLCDPECRPVRDGKPLYSDDDHLSTSGSLAIVAPLIKLELVR